MKNSLHNLWIAILAIHYHALVCMIAPDNQHLVLNKAHLTASHVLANCFDNEHGRTLDAEDVEKLILYHKNKETVTSASFAQKKLYLNNFLTLAGDEFITAEKISYRLEQTAGTSLINMLLCADFFDTPSILKTTKSLILKRMRKGFDEPQSLDLLPPNIAHIFLRKSSWIAPALAYFMHKAEVFESSFHLKHKILSIDIWNKYLVCAQEDSVRLYVYNKKDIALLRTIENMPNANVTFSKKGTYLAIVLPTHIIIYTLNNLIHRTESNPLFEKIMPYCSSIAFNHNDTHVAFAHSPKAITITNLQSLDAYTHHVEKVIGNLWWDKQMVPQHKPALVINMLNDLMMITFDSLLSNYETPINELLYDLVHHETIPLTAEQKKFAHLPMYICSDQKKAVSFLGKRLLVYNINHMKKTLSLGQTALIKNVYNSAKKEEKFDFNNPKNREYKKLYDASSEKVQQLLAPFIAECSNKL